MSYKKSKSFKITHRSIIVDAKIELKGVKSSKEYPKGYRLIIANVLRDKKVVRMEFITNNFDLAASTICDLYKGRWDIEIFFKQLKQTLKLSDFLGYSENAVQWQIWIALLTYIILRFIAYIGKWKGTFARMFTAIRGVLWSRLDLYDLLKYCGTATGRKRSFIPHQQLSLPLFK
jgi:transposase